MRLKWKKARIGITGRVLATNGAHKDPELYALMTDAGDELAHVRRAPGGWSWWINGTAHGVCSDLGRAKDLAKEEVRRKWKP